MAFVPVVPALGIIGAGMALIAALLDLGIRSGWDWKQVGVAASGPVLIWVPVGLIFWRQVDAYARRLLEERTVAMLEQLGAMGFSQEMVDAVEETVPRTIDLTVGMLPSQVAIMGLLVGFGALLAAHWWFERGGGETRLDIPPFTTWEVPSPLVWGMVAGLLILTAGMLLPEGETASLIGWNTVIVVGLFYWIQGTAIVWYSFVTRDTPRWVRVVFAIAGATLLVPGLVVLGILEQWIPFRRLMAGAEGSGIEEDE
jgi:uncharacterized protein YybS (DUF2232 family)